LLNLIYKDQLGGSAGEDANAIVKLKLSPSLRGKGKEWLLSLPTGSLNSLDNLKEAFIKRCYPHVKILWYRNSILDFRQSVATAWEWLKVMLRTCQSHRVNE
jgi:hypothetical protein